MTAAELERELRSLADTQPWPLTPDISTVIAFRIQRAGRRRAQARLRARAGLVVGLAVLAVLTTIAVAVAPVRAALGRALGIFGSERVVRVDRVPAAQALGLGKLTTLIGAQRDAHFVPALPTCLGAPDRVWFGGDFAGRAVSLGYGHDTVLTEIPKASVVLALKMVGPDVTVRRVRIARAPGLWIVRGPRTLVLPGAMGTTLRRSALPGAHILLWDRPGIALRLETHRPLTQALPIAESVGSATPAKQVLDPRCTSTHESSPP